MSKPHLEILSKTAQDIFIKLPEVNPEAVLTGGTALALQIGHRRSYDFDLTVAKPVKKELLKKIISIFSDFKVSPRVDSPNELTVIVGKDTKITYFHYPYSNLHPLVKLKRLKAYSLPDIASSKAHVIGRRGEWKDYFDLYFLIKKVGLDIEKIAKEANKRFSQEFDEKLFWEQLVYWGDLQDFEVDYLQKPVPKEKIQVFFKKIVKNKFST